MMKRALDFMISLGALVVLSPILLVVAVLVRATSPGPALHWSHRIGRDNRPFEMPKFRTMRIDTPQLPTHLLTDGRKWLTPIGSFLRRSSLDELPQLWSVLTGTMSLVGPRPELPYLVEKYDTWQRKRFAVPPGMTGWWQVNGRSERMMHLHTEDDLYYVNNYSIWLDIQILIRTIWTVLLGKGAY